MCKPISGQDTRNALNFFYDSIYFTPPLLPDELFAKRELTEETHNANKQEPLMEDRQNTPVIKLYPNPAQNEINIEYDFVAVASKLYIVNAIGRTVEEYFLNAAGGKLTINTVSYPNGIYLARIETGNKALLKNKFIILK